MTRHASLPARLALLAIRGYQRYLSPIKGYSCAFRVATQAHSCSAYGRHVIERRGLAVGLRLLRRRLDLCGLAHRDAQGLGYGHGPRHRQQGFLDAGCDAPCDSGVAHGVTDVMDCLGPGCGGPGDCEWPWRRARKLKAGDSKDLEKFRARVEARKRKQPGDAP